MSENPSYLSTLQERFGGRILEVATPHDQAVAIVQKEALNDILTFLRDDEKSLFDLFLDLTAVDYLGRKPRFEVVIHLVSIPLRQRLRIKVLIDEEDAQMPSITPVYPAANWFERECYDLYGIKFTGHPNLQRLLLYEGFEGHPLRKDYPVKGRQPRLELRKPEVKRSDQAVEP
ncbi:MAG: NADH-quinone oxidoreductase subunit C [bacterium]